MALELYNTYGHKKEPFDKPAGATVGLYDCGPTVYDYAHIGNLRSYVFADILRRTLTFNGYTVHQVINVTDIGHLTSDADDGEDKMTKALKREGKPLTLEAMRDVAEFYFGKFKNDLRSLNILLPQEFPFASNHIQENIKLIETLTEKGFTYVTSDGIYFDTEKDLHYGKLGGLTPLDAEHSRIGINTEKHSVRDFALWKFNSELGYDAPFGKGFPGWHIECSAMSMKYLGESFDIHTGGIDHISVHHNNEIAQSECATGKPLAHFWMHNAFLNINGEKIAKSIGNTVYLRDLESHAISPLAYRLWLLMAHYRTLVNFSWEALSGTENALKRLYRLFINLGDNSGTPIPKYVTAFTTAINNDLNTPETLPILWEMLADETTSKEDRRATALLFDTILGLGFDTLKNEAIPIHIRTLIEARTQARTEKKWEESDRIREELLRAGYEVSDSNDETVVRKIS